MMKRIGTYLKENPFMMILLIIFVVGALSYGIYEIVYQSKNAEQQNAYEQMWANARVATDMQVPQSDEEQEPTPLDEFLNEGNNRELYGEYLTSDMLDFEVLKGYNEDVIGYILIPGTEISYPILQSEDNDYYLHHNMDGSKGYPGCIYAESYNAPTLDDPLTILYGHNMRSNSMFGTLDEFRHEEYRQEHPYIIVYLPQEVRVYEVVVATKYTSEHLLSDRFNKEDDGTYTFHGFAGDEGSLFVKDMAEYNAKGSYADLDAVEKEDEILVLSTCTGSNMRYIVGAKRII